METIKVLWINGVQVGIDKYTWHLLSAGQIHLIDYRLTRETLQTFFIGNVQNLMVFPSALTDEQLTDLTGTVQTSFNSLALSLGYTIL